AYSGPWLSSLRAIGAYSGPWLPSLRAFGAYFGFLRQSHMLKVSLINPPFASLAAPSFALTQLREILRERFDEQQLQVSIHYLNIDFGQYLGYEIYSFIATSVEALNCGIGEWMFRQIAFPQTPDNTDQYFRRYGLHLRGPDGKSFWPLIL